MSAVTLSAAGNVLVPAYLALVAKGYIVAPERSADGTEFWVATGHFGRLVADDTLGLLGLLAILEVRGVEWLASDAEIDAFLTQFSVSTAG